MVTTDPLQAAPLTDAEIRTLRCLFATRRIDHGLDYECVTLGQALKLLATIDHLKSSAERTGPEGFVPTLERYYPWKPGSPWPFTPPASVVSAPAPGEVEQLIKIVCEKHERCRYPNCQNPFCSKDIKLVKDILADGYRKSLPAAEVVELRKALRPFVKLWAPDIDEAKLPEDHEIACNIRVRDLRRAVAALHPTPTAPLRAQVTDKTEAGDMREKGEGE